MQRGSARNKDRTRAARSEGSARNEDRTRAVRSEGSARNEDRTRAARREGSAGRKDRTRTAAGGWRAAGNGRQEGCGEKGVVSLFRETRKQVVV